MALRRRRVLAASGVLVLALTACAAESSAPTGTSQAAPAACPVPQIEPGSTTTLELTDAGLTREAVLHVPSDNDGTTPAPAILLLHGAGSNAAQMDLYTDLADRAGARGYVVITPEGTGAPQRFNVLDRPELPDDVAFIGDLLDEVGQRWCLDEQRIYATGASNGSALAGLLACQLGDTSSHELAGVVLVAAVVPPSCADGDTVSVMSFHGTDDPVVPYGEFSLDADDAAAPSSGGALRDRAFVEGTVQRWAEHDGCGADPAAETIGEDVVRFAFASCADGTEVIHHRIVGGGHTWPGGSVDLEALGLNLGSTTFTIAASDEALDFFDRHPTR